MRDGSGHKIVERRVGRDLSSHRRYTLGIGQKPNTHAFEKRCAAYAHVGRYKEALADAEHVLKLDGSPASKLRVKTIKDFLRVKNEATSPGHEHAAATLICTLTPREHRQWRSVTPSPYTRPYPFGVSTGY